MFVLAIIFLIIAVVGVILAFVVGAPRRTVTKTKDVGYREFKDVEEEVGGTRKWYLLGAGVFFVLAILFTFFSTLFQVDTGETKVLKDWSGVVADAPVTSPGFHSKLPWQDE